MELFPLSNYKFLFEKKQDWKSFSNNDLTNRLAKYFYDLNKYEVFLKLWSLNPGNQMLLNDFIFVAVIFYKNCGKISIFV